MLGWFMPVVRAASKAAVRIRQGWEICHAYRQKFFILAAIILGLQIAKLAIAYAFGVLIDGFRYQDSGWLYIQASCVFGAAVIATALVVISKAYFLSQIGYPIEKEMAVMPLRKMATLSMGDIVDNNLGRMSDIVKKGQKAIRDIVDRFFTGFLPVCFQLSIVVPGLFLVHRYLGVIGILSFALYILECYRINRRILEKVEAHEHHGNSVECAFFSVLDNFRLVKSVSYEEREIAAFDQKYQAYCDEGVRVWVKTFLAQAAFTMYLISSVCLGGLIMASVSLFVKKEITVGDAVVAVTWAWSAFDAMGSLGESFRLYMQSKPVVSAFFDLVKRRPSAIVAGAKKPEHLRESVEVSNLSFRYPRSGSGKEAVSNVSFRIEGGRTCAIVGPSGSGKSTLMNLLLGYHIPTEGFIKVGGVDLRDIDDRYWRGSVSYVDQTPRFWDGATLRDNLVYGLNGKADKISESDLLKAIRSTQLEQMLNRLGKDAWRTPIGKGGEGLSGGEWQRLSIARAILRDPQVMFFDEPTSALDSKNAALVSEAIFQSAKGRTCFIIAHRVMTAMQADQIIVMDQGRIVAIGSHTELNMSCAQYQDLLRSQFAAKDGLVNESSTAG